MPLNRCCVFLLVSFLLVQGCLAFPTQQSTSQLALCMFRLQRAVLLTEADVQSPCWNALTTSLSTSAWQTWQVSSLSQRLTAMQRPKDLITICVELITLAAIAVNQWPTVAQQADPTQDDTLCNCPPHALGAQRLRYDRKSD